MNNLFNLVQALTVADDAVRGLALPNSCHENCIEKQKLVDVINDAKEKGLKIRQKIREAKIKSGEVILLDYKGVSDSCGECI